MNVLSLSDTPFNCNCETQASETPAKGGNRRCKVRAARGGYGLEGQLCALSSAYASGRSVILDLYIEGVHSSLSHLCGRGHEFHADPVCSVEGLDRGGHREDYECQLLPGLNIRIESILHDRSMARCVMLPDPLKDGVYGKHALGGS